MLAMFLSGRSRRSLRMLSMRVPFWASSWKLMLTFLSSISSSSSLPSIKVIWSFSFLRTTLSPLFTSLRDFIIFLKKLTKYVTSINDTLLIVGFSQTPILEFVFSISASCWDTTDFAWLLPNLRTFFSHSPYLLCLWASVLRFQTNRSERVIERPHYPPSLISIDSFVVSDIHQPLWWSLFMFRNISFLLPEHSPFYTFSLSFQI